MSETVSTYIDEGETIYDQMLEILVVCPRCRACAYITPHPAAKPSSVDYFTPRRVVCRDCGYIKEWEGQELGFDWYGDPDPMRDSYFGLPLWLQPRCCGHVLWAYNRHHLGIIEKYIQAQLRVCHPDPKLGWYNKRLVNRLPEWMIIAKHRQAVLEAIAKLKVPRKKKE